MSKKKFTILGKGTAGCISLMQLKSKYPNAEVVWQYDPYTLPQSVGEGSVIGFPETLRDSMDWFYDDLKQIDGTFKHGIKKVNWGGSGDFFHPFPLHTCGIHFNANKFQSKILDKFQNQIKIIENKITDYSQIDSDHIIDCSGKPQTYNNYNNLNSIPVNSAFITQCYWDKPEFDYTLTIARPYGWVFGIPLQNRCSIGYLYNKNINTLEEVKEDIKEIFKQYNLNPSEDTKSLNFNNYYKKENFSERVTYNGNSSFFLEPMEATSIWMMMRINSYSFDRIDNKLSLEQINHFYDLSNKETENMIMLHYLAGSKFNTPFWKFAQEQAYKHISNNLDGNFLQHIRVSNLYYKNQRTSVYPHFPEHTQVNYGSWNVESFNYNLKGLDLYNKLDSLIKNKMTRN